MQKQIWDVPPLGVGASRKGACSSGRRENFSREYNHKSRRLSVIQVTVENGLPVSAGVIMSERFRRYHALSHSRGTLAQSSSLGAIRARLPMPQNANVSAVAPEYGIVEPICVRAPLVPSIL